MNADLIADVPAAQAARLVPKTPNLILHCGARAVQMQQVSAVLTPEPTASWHPIPYGPDNA